MKKLFLILSTTIFLMLSGCAVLDPYQEKASEKISDLIVKYCANVDTNYRLKLRQQINEKLGGEASIEIKCDLEVGVVDGRDIKINRGRWGHGDAVTRLSSLESKQKNYSFGIYHQRRPEGRSTATIMKAV